MNKTVILTNCSDAGKETRPTDQETADFQDDRLKDFYINIYHNLSGACPSARYLIASGSFRSG